MRTIQFEDGSLGEISDLFLELFMGVGIGGSNIILLGSATSLISSGSSGYVFEWLACAKKLSQDGQTSRFVCSCRCGRIVFPVSSSGLCKSLAWYYGLCKALIRMVLVTPGSGSLKALERTFSPLVTHRQQPIHFPTQLPCQVRASLKIVSSQPVRDAWQLPHRFVVRLCL